jgi:flagellin
MAEITLSKAVRSNLLNLQSTAALMSKTQERLATGLKVNSALDNPTNFFTASALNSRASDLGLLLDSVSNAVQTLAAADKGITAITKLVESAQATARQALQTAATIEQTTTTGGSAATSASVTAGSFSAINVSATGSSAQAGSLQGGTFSALNVSGTGSSAEAATITAGAFSNVDLSGGSDAISFTLTVDGSDTTVSIDSAAVTAYNTANSTTLDVSDLSAQDIADLINDQVGSSVASVNGDGNLVFTSSTSGSSSNLTVANYSATVSGGSTGIANATDTGADAVAADSVSFSLSVDGGSPTTITIDDAAVAAYNSANSTSLDSSNLSAADVAALINDQAGASIASVDGDGNLVLTSTSSGAGSSVAVSSFSANASGGDIGLANGTGSGSAATSADSISFSVNIDGAGAQSITISSATVAAYNSANSTSFDASNLSAANVAAMINDQAGASIASVNGAGNLVFASSTTGTGSTVAITGFSASASGGSTGIANASATGSAATSGTTTTTTVANPKRDELRVQYNELLSQIDDLAKDAGFNGVNLIKGDTLSVLFNEDGSSKLDIGGVSFDSAGLGLTGLSAGAFDDNADINSTLADLKSGIETLRAQASKFGSNLSVVETRQDFTKNMINVLQTGAANLTLADTNEEAANLLALQTRQQLSSTALSLASQADQQVLRLF